VADGLWIILLLIAVVFAYVLAKVRYYMKQSEQQWRDVDKSKLREWEDDDD
jgi:beta-lactamase regulating signal transducer with metallopeptidase domain